MNLKTYFKKYFLSDLIILTILAGLIYLPGKVFADAGARAGQDSLPGQSDRSSGLSASKNNGAGVR